MRNLGLDFDTIIISVNCLDLDQNHYSGTDSTNLNTLMELPDHYFPVNPCPYSSERSNKRLTFAEYGAYQNSDLSFEREKSDLKLWPQKGQMSTVGLSAILPTIPLNDKPLENQWISRDRILGVSNLKDTVWKMNSVIFTLPLLKKKLQSGNKSNDLKQCINALHDLKKGKDKTDVMSILHKKLPVSVRALYEKVEDIGQAYNSNCWSGYNRDFYGGLLAHATANDYSTETLVHVKGETFNEICVSKVSKNSDTGLKSLSMASMLPGQSVFQLCTSNRSGTKALVCSRESYSCRIFSLCDDTLTLQEENNSEFNGNISSICFSPYMENEILASCPNGDIHLWDIESSTNPLRYGKEDRKSHVYEPWSTSFFGGHPRHIVMANETSVLSFDHRDKFQEGVVLFALSASFTTADEQIMAACCLGFPYHCVATDYSLFLLDNRFPKTPVLIWSTEMISPPQYLQSLEAREESKKLVLLASQQPAEMMCFPVDMTKARPPTAPIYPWRVSKIDEFSSIFSATDTAVSRRFKNSLAGFTAPAPNPDGSFTVYQLDSCGDIFYQTFDPENSSELPSHLGDSSTSTYSEPFKCFKACRDDQKAAAKSRVEQWLSALELQSFSNSPNASISNLDKKDGGPKLLDIDPKLMSEIFSCSPSEVEQIEQEQADHTKTRKVNPNWPHVKLNPLKKLLHEKKQTQLLLALRDGKDISELLKKREARHLRLKLLKRRTFSREERQNNPEKIKRNKLYQARKNRKQMEQTATSSISHSYTLESNLNNPHIPNSEQVNSLENSSRSEEINIFNGEHQLPQESSTSVEEPRPECIPKTETNDNDKQPEPYSDQMNPIYSKEEESETQPSISHSPRIGTPSLFSSSASSSSSSSTSSEEEIVVRQEREREIEDQAHSRHTSQSHQETLPYSNVISWLLFSNSNKKGTLESQRNEPTISVPAKISPTCAPDSSSTINKVDLLADIERKTDNIEDTYEDDEVSICSSQRENTLARPDLRRMVDPLLSGFLSSPKRAKKMRQTILE